MSDSFCFHKKRLSVNAIYMHIRTCILLSHAVYVFQALVSLEAGYTDSLLFEKHTLPFKNISEKFQVRMPILNKVRAHIKVNIKRAVDVISILPTFLFLFIPYVKKAKMLLATVV